MSAIGNAVGILNNYSAQYAAGAGNLEGDKAQYRAMRDHFGREARIHKWEEEKRAIAIDAKTYNNQAVGQGSRELAKS